MQARKDLETNMIDKMAKPDFGLKKAVHQSGGMNFASSDWNHL